MLLFENIRQAYNSLVLNKKRTILTMIGIIIGLSSVLSIVSIGDTVSKAIEDFMVQFFAGGNTLYFISGRDMDMEDEVHDVTAMKNHSFTYDEIYDFIESTDGIIIGMNDESNYQGQVKLMTDSEHHASTLMKGVSSTYAVTQKLRVEYGRFISLDECRYSKPVAVISDLAAKQLFGSPEKAIGETLDFDALFSAPYYSEDGEETTLSKKMSMSLTIVGVYEYETPTGMPDVKSENTVTDMYAAVSYVDMQFGEQKSKTFFVPFVVKDKASTAQAKEMITEFALGKFGGESDYQYSIMDMLDDLKQITNIVSIITGAFVLIAAISLLVGGIGLMNTMLVSVTERTKEIGIKKALGARNSSIRTQFLFESAMICLISCAVGVFFGMFFGMIIESNLDKLFSMITNDSFRYFLKNAEIHVTPSINAIFVSTLFSLAVGIIFGLYPANKGAKMQPVDALRYE